MEDGSIVTNRVTWLFVLITGIGVTITLLLPGEAGAAANQIFGVAALILTVILCFRAFKLYGWSNFEGKVWFLFGMALLLLAAGVALRSVNVDNSLLILRTIAQPVIVIAFIIKLRFAGVKLDIRSGSIVYIATLAWAMFTLLASIVPAVSGGGYDFTADPYPIFSIGNIFIIAATIMILHMDVTARGWVPLSWGLTMIAIADGLYTIGRQHFALYHGHAYDLLWYIGLVFIAYGAYYQRELHGRLI